MPIVRSCLSKWSWWLPFLLFQLVTWIPLSFGCSNSTTAGAITFAMALVLCAWWGGKVIPALYFSCLLSSPLWGGEWLWAPLHALPQTLAVALTYCLARHKVFDPTLPNLTQLLKFLCFGVLLPAVIASFGLMAFVYMTEVAQMEGWLYSAVPVYLKNCLAALVITVPFLASLQAPPRNYGTLIHNGGIRSIIKPVQRYSFNGPPWYLMVAVLLGLPWLLMVLPQLLRLPIIALLMLSMALLWGFVGSISSVVLSSVILLVLPLLMGDGAPKLMELESIELYFNMLLFMLATLLVGRSLTDHQQMVIHNKEIQHQLTLANHALEASPLGVTIADARQADTPLVYCNPAFERMSGYSRDELLGRNCRFMQAKDRNQLGAIELSRAIRKGEGTKVLLRNYRKDGEIFWNEVIVAPMHDGKGLSHFIGMQQDVSSREALTEKVSQQRAALLRQSHLFSQTEMIADIGGWVLYSKDMSMYWSTGCFRIYDLDADGKALTFQQAVAYMNDAGRELTRQTLHALVQGVDDFDIETHLTTAKGRQLWVRIRGVAEREDGRLVRVYGALQDLTERKRAEQQLGERDERMRQFFEAPLIGMALTNPHYGWVEVNDKLCSILGRSREQLLACSWQDISHPSDFEVEQLLLADVVSGAREGYELDKRFFRGDGSAVHTRLNLRAVRLSCGQVSKFLLLVEDISGRHEAEARYRTIVENAPEAIMLFTPQGAMVDVNENALRLLSLSRENLLDKTVMHISPQVQTDSEGSKILGHTYIEAALAGDTPVFDWILRDSHGRHVPCEVRLVRMPGEEPLIRGSVTDISDRQRYQREIERLAFSDELTGLPNRRLLLDRLQHSMDRERRERTQGALLFIDLDHFKTVNDSLGHLVGDALLREVSARLASQLRAEDTLARMGGDEFVVLLEGLGSNAQETAEKAAVSAEKLLKSLDRSVCIEGRELSISASIGIALHPLVGQAAADVLKQADTAMYRAKKLGRNALHFFEPSMQAAIDQRLHLNSELRQAIQRNQLYLEFQPQINLQSGEVVGAEVLLRWHHPELGAIEPSQFIALAEETGLIGEIGHWVLERTCEQLAEWISDWPQIVVAVNISPRELRRVGCVERVSNCLLQHNVPAHALELEVTEGVLLEDVEQCISNMRALRALGVRFTIDDFGTGYSSLTYLKRLPLDRLKIDRSFITDLDSDKSSLLLVQTVLMIARNMQIECVAEGIETQAHLEMLRVSGCPLGQGYLFSKPLSALAFMAWVLKHDVQD